VRAGRSAVATVRGTDCINDASGTPLTRQVGRGHRSPDPDGVGRIRNGPVDGAAGRPASPFPTRHRFLRRRSRPTWQRAEPGNRKN